MGRFKTTSADGRLSRSKSFFGLHFDFHATAKDRQIGQRPIEPTLDQLLRRVRPDYVQCDCKGHAGWSSYPTKVGYPAPNLRGDTLKAWRKVTAKHGVSLYMHFSGVWDTEAIKRHPSWARITEKGKRDPNNTSVFGPYVDAHLVPQLRELREVYGVDGYWIDGDCWAAAQDYGKKILREFHRQSGIRTVPRKPEDPHFFEFTEFCREGFRRYLRHYVDEIHRLCPGVEVASNWAFSSFMPEPVSANVDFVSGDYTLIDSVNSARLEGRCLMHQGKPWDLMAWAFSSVWEDTCRSTKTVVQLQREAATVLALGGGFQIYFNQRRDGSIRAQHLKLMQEVAAFCRARQKTCHKCQSVPQIALLYSSAAFYRLLKKVFVSLGGELNAMSGILNALLNNQYHADILSEHHLTGRMHDFPLIVIPEWDFLEEPFRQELLAYVQQGGKLLVIGAKTVPLFSAELGLRLQGVVEDKRWLEIDGELAGVSGLGLKFQPGRNTRVLANWHEGDDLESPSHPVAVSRKLGKGEIVGLAVNFGDRYRHQKTAQARKFLGALVNRLFPNPIVKAHGSHELDIVLMKKDGKLLVNLLNTSGPHDNRTCYSFDEIVPLGPIRVEIQMAKRPKRVLLQPEGRPLSFQWSRGKTTLVLPRLEIHAILEVTAATL